jgi:hypothetical protein
MTDKQMCICLSVDARRILSSKPRAARLLGNAQGRDSCAPKLADRVVALRSAHCTVASKHRRRGDARERRKAPFAAEVEVHSADTLRQRHWNYLIALHFDGAAKLMRFHYDAVWVSWIAVGAPLSAADTIFTGTPRSK